MTADRRVSHYAHVNPGRHARQPARRSRSTAARYRDGRAARRHPWRRGLAPALSHDLAISSGESSTARPTIRSPCAEPARWPRPWPSQVLLACARAGQQQLTYLCQSACLQPRNRRAPASLRSLRLGPQGRLHLPRSAPNLCGSACAVRTAAGTTRPKPFCSRPMPSPSTISPIVVPGVAGKRPATATETRLPRRTALA